MTKEKYDLNPNLFFIFEEGKLCLWDYKAHTQFEIEKDLFELLYQIAHGEAVEKSAFIEDLLEHNIITALGSKDFEGLKPHASWGWDRLSHIFHYGTQNVPELQEKRSKAEMIHDFIGFSEVYAENQQGQESHHKRSHEKSGRKGLTPETIALSSVDFSEKSSHIARSAEITEVLKKRLTTRHFSGEPIREQDLSSILYYTFAELHQEWEGVPEDVDLIGGAHKTSPSAGGIHSIRAFVTIFNVEGIKAGLYLYNPKEHTLELIHHDVSWDKVATIMADQFYMEGLAFGVFLVSDLKRVWAKYLHSRAYREIFLDAGHLSQTFQLMATARSLNTWISGYFRDDDLMSFLGLEGQNQAPILFVGAGKGERTPIHPDMLSALKDMS